MTSMPTQVIAWFLLSCVAAFPVVQFDTDGKTSYRHGQYVTVNWSGVVETDRSSCWLGLFFQYANMTYTGQQGFPATPPFLASAPIKFVSCNTPPGAGNLSIRLLAYRDPLEVGLFTGGFGQTSIPRLLARSPTSLVASDGGEPRFPRLAWTQSPGEMRLTWSSNDTNPQAAKLTGPSPHSSQSVMSSVKTYEASDLCAAPANSTGFAKPGYHHSVVFKNLSPGTYKYEVEQTLEGRFNISSARSSIRIGVIADVGATEPDGMHYHWEEPNASTTYQWTLARRPDLVLHLGDLAYATGYGAKWDLFLDQMTPISAQIPYMTALGNHEQDWKRGGGNEPHAFGGADSGGECALPTYTRFPMPVPIVGDQGQDNGWYNFTQGPTTFVIFNSEWNVTKGSPQFDFLHSALSSVDRDVTPWVVVGCHRPIYTKNRTDGADSMLGYEDVEDLLQKFEVDFMLYGHVHNAQRTCPIYRSQCTTNTTQGGFPGTVHAVIGNGGQSLVEFGPNPANWSLFQAAVFGFNELEMNMTTAVLRFFSDSGELLDETSYAAVLRSATVEIVV